MSDVFQKTLISLIKDPTWCFSGEIEYDNAEVQKIPKSKATLLAIFLLRLRKSFFWVLLDCFTIIGRRVQNRQS